MPAMPMAMPMLPGLAGLAPEETAFLPGGGIDPASLPEAVFRKVERLSDGDTLDLAATLVRRTFRGRTLVMYGFNGQHPGPFIQVNRDATIVVNFVNEIDLPTTVHWHGVRIDNRSDGVPGVTQEPVQPGERFTYTVHFPDAGIYWYHPHVRVDIQQDLGLYGNMLVRHPASDYFSPVNREEAVMLDDLLVDERGLFPFGEERAIQTLMGRFGNLLLVNGEPHYSLEVERGSVVRFFLTNVSNTRTFNLSFSGAVMKLVGADIGLFEREELVKSIVIAPAQRYIVEVLFDEPGDFALVNKIQAIDHFRGEFHPRVDTLGMVAVGTDPAAENHTAEFAQLRANREVAEEIDRYRHLFDRPVDRELVLTGRAGDLPLTIVQLMTIDTLYKAPVDFNDLMPMMNYLSSSGNVTWTLRDAATDQENMDVHWTFKRGEVIKIRLFNDPGSFHPMHHPIHIHGQRFLVLERDGVRNHNLVWKDTVVVPVGSRVDILLEASNPGDWLAHCHILEHVEAGMMMLVSVVDAESGDR